MTYSEMLDQIEARISALQEELETLRGIANGLAVLSHEKDAEAPRRETDSKYLGVGTTAAVRDVLSNGELLSREEIANRLRAGGWNTNSSNPLSALSATLAQAHDIVKVGDRFRKRIYVTGSVEKATSQTEDGAFVA